MQPIIEFNDSGRFGGDFCIVGSNFLLACLAKCKELVSVDGARKFELTITFDELLNTPVEDVEETIRTLTLFVEISVL